MKLFILIERLKLLNKLIEAEKTKSPNDFAKRLGISRSALYDLIAELNSMGTEIRYSRTKSSFYYASPKRLHMFIEIKIEKE